jgi:phage tail sheath protein FI
MPVQMSYPGVRVEEVSSGVRTILCVATSITASIGRFLEHASHGFEFGRRRGPIPRPGRFVPARTLIATVSGSKAGDESRPIFV